MKDIVKSIPMLEHFRKVKMLGFLNFSCAKRYRKSYSCAVGGRSKIGQTSREEGVHFDLVDELCEGRRNFAIIEAYKMMEVGNVL